MTEFYICRHGQTENNALDRLSGWIDTPLTEKGQQNSLIAANKLRSVKLDVIVSSDLGRAFTTAYIIARQLGYSDEIERYKELRDINYGNLANRPVSEYPAISPEDNASYVVPGGESLLQLQERVLACIDNLSLENANKTVLVVAHDGTINAINAAYLQKNIGEVDAESSNGHGFVARFVYDNGTVSLYEPL